MEKDELKHVGGGWYAYKKEDGSYSEPFVWKGKEKQTMEKERELEILFTEFEKSIEDEHIMKCNTYINMLMERKGSFTKEQSSKFPKLLDDFDNMVERSIELEWQDRKTAVSAEEYEVAREMAWFLNDLASLVKEKNDEE